MSELLQLKNELRATAADCRKTAGQMAPEKKTIEQHAAQVDHLIRGTASKADQQITELLAVAAKAVENSMAQLGAAAKACADYADRL